MGGGFHISCISHKKRLSEFCLKKKSSTFHVNAVGSVASLAQSKCLHNIVLSQMPCVSFLAVLFLYFFLWCSFSLPRVVVASFSARCRACVQYAVGRSSGAPRAGCPPAALYRLCAGLFPPARQKGSLQSLCVFFDFYILFPSPSIGCSEQV